MDRLEYLIESCKKNDRSAQREIFEMYSAKMLGICRRYCKTLEDAQDMFQEGFLKVFTNFDTFKGESSLETWMKRIFINGALNQYRKAHMKHDHVEFEPELHDTQANPDDDETMFSGISSEYLLNSLQQLPEQYRIVINMHILDGIGHKQIAAMLNTTESNSKSRLSRARVMLKKLLMKRK